VRQLALQHAHGGGHARHADGVDDALALGVEAAIGRDHEHQHVGRLHRVQHCVQPPRRPQQRQPLLLARDHAGGAVRRRLVGVGEKQLRHRLGVGQRTRRDECDHLGRTSRARRRALGLLHLPAVVHAGLLGRIPPRGLAAAQHGGGAGGARACHAVRAARTLARTTLRHGRKDCWGRGR
jgi:hypothetical protein